MPRPRLHHTPEDKKAADRERSKRYYEKQAPINFYINSRLIYTIIGIKQRYGRGEKINTGKLGMLFLWIFYPSNVLFVTVAQVYPCQG